MASVTEVPRKVWTRQEAHALVDLGFPNAKKLELVDGDLIDRMGKSHAHVLWQTLMRAWLAGVFGELRVQVESPIDVCSDVSEPEPDLIVTAKSIREYRSIPYATDLLLVIEIADSTLSFDLNAKAALYAQSGVAEYWVIGVSGRRLIVMRQPDDGIYSSVANYGFEDEVTPLAAPQAVFCLARL